MVVFWRSFGDGLWLMTRREVWRGLVCLQKGRAWVRVIAGPLGYIRWCQVELGDVMG
jgi:hypothetical protein